MTALCSTGGCRLCPDRYNCGAAFMTSPIKQSDQIDSLVLHVLYKKIEIEKVIFNDPATIVFWSDGGKTVVKVCDGEQFDPEKGLAMAISKRFLRYDYKSVFKKYIDNDAAACDSFVEKYKEEK